MFTTCEPITVDVFPPIVLDLPELEQNRVKGAWFEPRYGRFYDGEHASAIFGDNHFVGETVEFPPQI